MSALSDTVMEWLNDDRLRFCSAASFRLWLRLLVLMETSNRPGFLQFKGSPLNAEDIARLVHCPTDEATNCLLELSTRGISCVTKDNGTIFCRKLVTALGAVRRKALARTIGFVYAIHRGRDGATKIGFSMNVETRIKHLGEPNLRILNTWRVESMPFAEAQLHKLFHPKRLDGEWFALTAEDLVLIEPHLESCGQLVSVGQKKHGS